MGKPIYCKECRSQKSYERYPDGDIKTENGQAYMLKWQCSVCGKLTLTTNEDYIPIATYTECKSKIS